MHSRHRVTEADSSRSIMIRTIALLCFVSTALGYEVGPLVEFKRTTLLGLKVTDYLAVPKYESDAESLGWVNKTKADDRDGYDSLTMYCPPKDYVICALYDDTGFIAGLQGALNVDEITDTVIDWIFPAYVNWTTESADGTMETYYTLTEYYVSTESLATNASTRLTDRDSSKVLQEEYVYVPDFTGDLMAIPTNAADIATNFTKEGCIATQGIHYFYNMSEELECTVDQMLPWFPLVYNGELIGMGFAEFGKYATNTNGRSFVTVTESQFRKMVPTGPKCMFELVKSLGLISVNVYFVKQPSLITCIPELISSIVESVA